MKKYLPSRLFIIIIVPLLFFVCSAALAQTNTVTGKVTSSDGPLPGVNVLVKGTTNGTVTDSDGNYSLKVDPNGTLVFSFIGFLTEEVTVNSQSKIDFIMSPDITTLSEIVVVGYGTQRKLETTGAVASVKAEELTQTPVTNLAQGLQARVAGVQITQNSSAPGGNISVRIRGTNSINGTSEPLYVIDGIQIANSGGVNDVSPLSTINPNDIESIEILKDASATAIYGSRGANGVVLISTKRGKSGDTRVSIESYYGVQTITRKLDMLNATQFAELENDIYRTPANATPVYADPSSLGEGVDWQDLVFKEAPIQSHQISLSGGSDKTQLSLSGNYFNQDGIAMNSNFKRYSFRASIDHKINDRVKIGTNILGSYSINQGIPTGSTSLDGPAVTTSLIGATLGAPPTLEAYRPDGSIFPFGDQLGGRYREVVNPLGLASILNETGIKRTLVNLYAEAELTKGLTYRATFNTDLQSSLNDYYSPRSIVNTADLNANSGVASKTNLNSTLLLHESILTYSKTFSQHHNLKITGVFATQSDVFDRNIISASGLPNDKTTNQNLALAVNRNISSLKERQRLDSYMGRVNYGFKDKYFLTVTARADGASKFGENNKYGFFPAVAAGWRIIDEEFLKGSSLFSDLKLRGSYGVTGNAGAIAPYRSLSLSGPGSDYQFNHVYVIGISPVGIANPDLGWERSTQWNIGLDIGLIKDRVSLVVDYYNKDTEKLLYDQALPLSSGYNNITKNVGQIENSGIELALNAQILTGDLKWTLGANFTANRNKIISIDGGITTERFASFPGGVSQTSILKVGQPIGLFKTYVFDGIYQTGETILPGSGSRIGGVKVRDIAGGANGEPDGQITAADQIIAGDPNPDFIFGFTSNFSYKNFDLGIFISGSQGNDIYNLSRYSLENPLGQRNMLAGVANRWSPTNPNNEYVSGFQGGRIPITDRFVEDGSFIRCKNITLGYKLPKIKGIYSARIYVSANNLFTITNYSGYDPEVNSFGNSNANLGVDNLVYPNSRTILGGVQITF
jgi:TonB-dependent starch-binding outer membrane protein SusC